MATEYDARKHIEQLTHERHLRDYAEEHSSERMIDVHVAKILGCKPQYSKDYDMWVCTCKNAWTAHGTSGNVPATLRHYSTNDAHLRDVKQWLQGEGINFTVKHPINHPAVLYEACVQATTITGCGYNYQLLRTSIDMNSLDDQTWTTGATEGITVCKLALAVRNLMV